MHDMTVKHGMTYGVLDSNTEPIFAMNSAAADLVQVPGIEHEENPFSSKDSPDSDHATARVMQLGPGQATPSCTLCQKCILAQLIQACTATQYQQQLSIHGTV